MSDSAETLADGRMWVSLSGRTYTVAAARPESAAFWTAAANGRWEDETFRFLDAVTHTPGAVLVDVGAWIGPAQHCMPAAQVDAPHFTPSPIAGGASLSSGVHAPFTQGRPPGQSSASLHLNAPSTAGSS